MAELKETAHNSIKVSIEWYPNEHSVGTELSKYVTSSPRLTEPGMREDPRDCTLIQILKSS